MKLTSFGGKKRKEKTLKILGMCRKGRSGSRTPLGLPSISTRVLLRTALLGPRRGIPADAAGPELRSRGAGSRVGSRAEQFAREWDVRALGRQVGRDGSCRGAKGKPGWRLRAGRPRPQAPWPPRELTRKIPRRRSRARVVRVRRRLSRCRRPDLLWKGLSSASRWRTSCEWPEAARRRGRQWAHGRGARARRVCARGWGCVWLVDLALNL